MLKKVLMAASMAVTMLAFDAGTAFAQQSWVAVSTYGNRYFVGRGWSEESARDEALGACARGVGRTCSRRLSASVPSAGRSNWFLVVARCPNGMAPGGSQISFANALHMAAQRRGYQSWACSMVDWGN